MASEEKILGVGDDVDMAALLEGEPGSLGDGGEIRHEGASALSALEARLPELLLLDPAGVIMKEGALDFMVKDFQILNVVGPRVECALESQRLKRKLNIVQERLLRITTTIKDVFWIMNAEGNETLYVSPAFEKIWGFPVAALSDDPGLWNERNFENDRSKTIRAFVDIRDGWGNEAELVYRIYDQEGIEHWIRDRVYATRNERGELLCLTGVAHDITDPKRLEGQVVEATEHERIRIGQALHDDHCQRLAALKLACGEPLGVLRDEGHPSSRHHEGDRARAGRSDRLPSGRRQRAFPGRFGSRRSHNVSRKFHCHD